MSPLPLQRVVVLDRRQRLAAAQPVDDIFEFLHAESTPLAGAKILLELAGDTERLHALHCLAG
jgi:hypothetical protein